MCRRSPPDICFERFDKSSTSLEGEDHNHKYSRTYRGESWCIPYRHIPVSDCIVYGDILDADIVEVELLVLDVIERRPSRINDCVKFDGIAYLLRLHISSHSH